MRGILLIPLVLAALCPSVVNGQEAEDSVVVEQMGTWTSGEPGPFPVRVTLRRGSSDAPLDSAAVLEATRWGLIATGTPPDVTVTTSPAEYPGIYLAVQVDTYAENWVYYKAVVVGQGEEPRCHQESKWRASGLPSVLALSHKVRDTVALCRDDVNR